MVVKNGKSATKRKITNSSARSNRSHSVSKSGSNSDITATIDKLDGTINHDESTALQGEAGSAILEKAGNDCGAPGLDLSSESLELTAITLHQPWASLIAAGKKQYETRSWATDYRGPIAIHAGKKFEQDIILINFLEISAAEVPLGAVVAIADLADCILMTKEFISQQSATELRCGDWKVGRYAWKLENVRAIEPIPATGKQGLWKWKHTQDSTVNSQQSTVNSQQSTVNSQQSTVNSQQSEAWNPADFGELHHVAEADGQLNLLDWTDREPPEPDDYSSIELFDAAYKQWCDAQTDEAEEELTNFGVDELRDQLISKLSSGGFDKSVLSDSDAEDLIDFLLLNGEQECKQLMDGSICAAELVPASLLQESNCGEKNPIISANGTNTANQSSDGDSPTASDSAISKPLILETQENSSQEYSLSLLARLANHSAKMENDALPTTIATVSPTYSEQFEICNQDSPSSKTLLDCSTAPIPPVTNQEVTLDLSSTPYRQVGTMRNGSVSGVMNLPLPGVGKGYLLLRSPGALSHSGKASPPGKTRLENQLLELGLISTQEVAAPEFLETGYQLPIGWTNLEENRTANELVQALQLPIAPKSELPAVTETTAIDVQPSETLSIGELQPLDFDELNISVSLPPNIGALTKIELISMAQEQHQLICVIERKEFELAIEKLHRVRLTGIYLQEFKKKCGYGEFENQLEQAGIGVRSAQNYMTIAKNWDIVEAKTKLVALLAEENQPAIGLKWAIEAVRDEKKQLKSAAPPKDPDSWRTPNTKEQPIVDLVKQALGGLIWLDPCSGAVSNNIPCSVRYFKENDGLSPHQGWSKTVYINPPFSDPLPWVERCCLEFARGSVSAAVMLLKAGTLSNVGTGELINKYASAVCHWRGRINFLNDEGNAVKGSDFDCVLVYFGARLDLFRKAFGGRGTISTIDNHYSSVNKKFTAESEPDSVREEERQIAAAMGLSNGKSLLPDRRDDDREMMERYDPHTVSHEFMPSQVLPKINPEIEADCDDKFDQAKRSCLNDYITAISSNISDFSDEQLAFLAKIINEESAKRIDF